MQALFAARRPEAPLDERLRAGGVPTSAQARVRARDPESGALFCFVNKRANRLKVLWWDRNGYCLLYKRLHRALFRLPERGAAGSSVRIDGRALAMLIAGVDKERKQRRSRRSG